MTNSYTQPLHGRLRKILGWVAFRTKGTITAIWILISG